MLTMDGADASALVGDGVGEDRVKVPSIKDGVEPGLKIGNRRP